MKKIMIWLILLVCLVSTVFGSVTFERPTTGTYTNNHSVLFGLNVTENYGDCTLYRTDKHNNSDTTNLGNKIMGVDRLDDYVFYADLDLNLEDKSNNGHDYTSVSAVGIFNSSRGIGKGSLNVSAPGNPRYVQFNNVSSSSFTFSTWVRADEMVDGYVMNEFGDTNMGWGLTCNANVGVERCAFVVRDNKGGDNVNSGTGTIQALKWVHVAGSFDNNTKKIKIYVNGDLKNSKTSSYGHVPPSTPFEIGRKDTSYWDGLIDEVKIWNYTLTDNEITQLYIRNTYFYLNSNSSITNIFGLNKNATLTGTAKEVDGRIAGVKALSFDYTSVSGICMDSVAYNMTNEATLSAWVKLGLNPADGSPTARIIAGHDYSHGSLYYAENNNNVYCSYEDSLGNTVAPSMDISTLNNLSDKYYHLVCTTNGTSVFIYVDGVLKNSASGLSGTLDNTFDSQFCIGSNEAKTRRINMSISEVGIWTKHMDQSEVIELMNQNYTQTYYEINDTDLFNKDTVYTYNLSCTDIRFGKTLSTTANIELLVDHVPKNYWISLSSNAFFTNQLNITINSTEKFPYSLNLSTPSCITHQNTSLVYGFQLYKEFNISNCSLGTYKMNITFCEGNTTKTNCTSNNHTWYNMAKINFNATNLTGDYINNFSIYVDNVLKGSTTNGNLDITNVSAGTRSIKIVPLGYQIKTINFSVTDTVMNYTFKNLYYGNSINITFFDSDTLMKLSSTNITLQLIGDTPKTYTVTDGDEYVTSLLTDTYTLLYDAEDYQQGKYVVHLTNQSFQNIYLYLQKENTSSRVLINVEDKFGNSLRGVEIIIQKYNNNTWRTDQIIETDFNGQSEGYYVLSTTYYNHVLRYKGNTYFGKINNDDYKKIIYPEDVTNGIKFNIDILGDNIYDDYKNNYNVSSNLSYVNQSVYGGYFRFYFSNPANTNVEGCVYIYQQSNYSLINSTCLTTSTGTIIMPINHTEPGTRMYTALTTIDSYYNDDYMVILGTNSQSINWGPTGYFIGFLIVTVAFFMFLSVPTLSVIMGSFVFVVLAGFGLYFKDINYGFLITYLVISYLVATIKSDSGVNG